MAREICGNTKVTIQGKSTICKTFPEIWELFKANGIECTEKTKETIIRILFIQSYLDLSEHGADVQMEIVWED